MKFTLTICAIVILSIFSTVLASELKENKSLIKPPPREYIESRFDLRLYQGFGFRNISWDLDVNYQFRQYFSVGIGNSFHRNKYPIYSSSDKHLLKMWSYPVYIKTNIILSGNSERSIYIFGKYGRAFSINTKGVHPNKDFKAISVEGGFGYERIRNKRSAYFELAQYYINANGVFNSTYNSTINYDLQIYTIVARIGFKF